LLNHILTDTSGHVDLSLLEWHTISTDEALRRLGSSMTEGMSLAQAERKIKEFGRNIPSPPESHMIKQVLGYFFKGFGPILLVGAILVFVSWKPLGDPPAVANLVRKSYPVESN
jgi:sodium/potassium-transporting ATPase subunit alpha